MLRFPGFILIAAFCLTSVLAQTPTPTPPGDDTIKISTTLIQVDVTVTDKNGKAITDLKPEDFEVYENGKKQTVTNFSYLSADKPSEKNDSPNNKNTSKTQPNKNSLPVPPVKLKMEQVRRTYALVVDDLGLSFGSIFWARQALKKFINEQVQEGDLVAIIRTGSGIGALQSFTSDKQQLLAAVEKIKWNAYGRGGISAFPPLGTTLKEDLEGGVAPGGAVKTIEGTKEEKEFLQQAEELRNQNFSVGTLGAISYIIRGMRDLPGRKAIMLLSEGFVLMSNGTPTHVLDAMRVLADQANRSSVVIYTLDPRGLQNALMANADDDIRDVFRGAGGLQARAQRFMETQGSLMVLANETGGTAYINQNDLNFGLKRAVEDQSNYYLLGYEPDEATFDPKKSKFNKLEIKVNRPGVKVRYRSGFFNVTDERLRAVTQTPRQKIVAALVSPFNASEVNLNLYPVFQNDATYGNVIQALVHIEAKDLQFAEVNGSRKATFDLMAMIVGDNGIDGGQLSKTYTIEVSEKVYQTMLAKGFVYTLPVPLKKAGAYQFRIALRDTASDKVGSASQFIEVPDIKKKLALSNLVLDNFSAQEWQKMKKGGNPDESETNALLDTTLRRFKRETILRYDYVVYNPKLNTTIESQLRLIKDGKIVYQEEPTVLRNDNPTDALRLQTAGAITLGKNLDAGTYVLQILVSDKSNAKRFASQFVEFEIVP